MWVSYKWRNTTSYQIRVIEQAKFAYPPLRKTFEKQAKTMKNIYSGKISMYEADVDQTNQSIYYDISRSKTKENKDKKQSIIDRVNVFYEGWD